MARSTARTSALGSNPREISTITGLVPDRIERVRIWKPAMCSTGSAKIHLPGRPSAAMVERAEDTSAAAESPTRCPVPVVDPEVCIISAVLAGSGPLMRCVSCRRAVSGSSPRAIGTKISFTLGAAEASVFSGVEVPVEVPVEVAWLGFALTASAGIVAGSGGVGSSSCGWDEPAAEVLFAESPSSLVSTPTRARFWPGSAPPSSPGAAPETGAAPPSSSLGTAAVSSSS